MNIKTNDEYILFIMKFCKTCDNMYYITLDPQDSNKLTYYCRNCGDVDNEETTQEIHCVLNTTMKRDDQKFHHIVNKYIKLDPTLPRIYTIPCPNESCSSNATDEKSASAREILYLRYDEQNLKYLYMCAVCNYTWHS
jgi:DNA-directed RNA polymerase subunit M/transcription elongation factor TFIIS